MHNLVVRCVWGAPILMSTGARRHARPQVVFPGARLSSRPPVNMRIDTHIRSQWPLAARCPRHLSREGGQECFHGYRKLVFATRAQEAVSLEVWSRRGWSRNRREFSGGGGCKPGFAISPLASPAQVSTHHCFSQGPDFAGRKCCFIGTNLTPPW